MPPSFQERRWLLSGKPGALLFLERRRVEMLWAQYGDVIVARHIANCPGTRPVNWWRFSATAPRRPGETQRQYLERHGLLLPSEKRARRRSGD
jgi:hypothetical protein